MIVELRCCGHCSHSFPAIYFGEGDWCRWCSTPDVELRPYVPELRIDPFPRERDLSGVILSAKHVWAGAGQRWKWGCW